MKPELEKLANESAVKLRSGLTLVAQALHPHDFRIWLFSIVMANVVGNMPDDYWEQMMDCKPCPEAGCDCHLMARQFMAAMNIIREDHKEYCNRTVTE